MYQFSDLLVQKTIQYFSEKHSQQITEEAAISYLNSMSDLFVEVSLSLQSETIALLQSEPDSN
jgi:hypothetical protein